MSPIFHFPFVVISIFLQFLALCGKFRFFNSLEPIQAKRFFITLKKMRLPVISDFLKFFESCSVLGYYFETKKNENR